MWKICHYWKNIIVTELDSLSLLIMPQFLDPILNDSISNLFGCCSFSLQLNQLFSWLMSKGCWVQADNSWISVCRMISIHTSILSLGDFCFSFWLVFLLFCFFLSSGGKLPCYNTITANVRSYTFTCNIACTHWPGSQDGVDENISSSEDKANQNLGYEKAVQNIQTHRRKLDTAKFRGKTAVKASLYSVIPHTSATLGVGPTSL